MKRYKILLVLGLFSFFGMQAQTLLLTPEQCRTMALKNNKNIAQKKLEQEAAYNTYKAAKTNYLPKVDIAAGYVLSGKEAHLLSKEQRQRLNTLGSSTVNQLNAGLAEALQKNPALAQRVQGILQMHPELGGFIQDIKGAATQMGAAVDALGSQVVDAFRTDTRNVGVAAIILKQPLYMGGKIKAYERITKSQQDLANEQLRQEEQEIILSTDRAYWQLVSLSHKLALANSYKKTLEHLNGDVEKMIQEGVATKANGLQVAVKLNEAEMLVTKVEDGMVLSRMLLCQLCGLPIDTPIKAADEDKDHLVVSKESAVVDTLSAFTNRPELRQLSTAVNIYKDNTKIVRSDFLPKLALMGGYGMTYPNVYNGFEKKFRGDWHVGVTLQIPVWNWFEGKYKVKAAQAKANMAYLKYEEIKEKIALQVTQEAFRVNEANKKLGLAEKNLDKANENLRVATLGYKEGVIAMTDVLAAETAWLQAHNEKIDAEIDGKLTRAALRKAIGERP